MYLKETGCEDIGWIKLAQNKDQWRSLTNTVANFRVPQHTKHFCTIWATKTILVQREVSFSNKKSSVVSVRSIIRHVCVQAWRIVELVKLVSKERESAARPTQGFQHCPQYVSHRMAVVALRPASYPESHHSPQKIVTQNMLVRILRCSATVTEIEQRQGLQILRKIELWMGFLHFNIVRSK